MPTWRVTVWMHKMTNDNDTALFQVIDNSVGSPVILHAPHGGRTIPAEYLSSFIISPTELEVEKDVMTDHFTDTLVGALTGASAIINGLSRFAVDVERFPDDTEERVRCRFC